MDNSRFNNDWMENVRAQIEDPLLALAICQLAENVNELLVAKHSENWRLYFRAVLKICRASRHIRLHVGNLNRMESAGRGVVRDVLVVAVENFVPAEQIDDSCRTEYDHATSNIEERLQFLHEDTPALAEG